eukprot:gene8565-biopygen13680
MGGRGKQRGGDLRVAMWPCMVHSLRRASDKNQKHSPGKDAQQNELKKRARAGLTVNSRGSTQVRGWNAPLLRPQRHPGRNGRERVPDASRTIEFEETDASRTRPQPFLPSRLLPLPPGWPRPI